MYKTIQGGPKPMGATGGPPGPPGGWLCQHMSRPQEVLFNIMVAFLQLIPQSTLTTVFPISRDIAQSFAISNPSVLPWLVSAYALSFGTFILIGGRLGDIFGHKSTVVIGYSLLSVCSVVAGLSHYTDYEVFFVARGLQGLGASFMVPNGLALLGRTYPPGSKQKVFSFTLFGLCAPVGAYLGMIFGALFTKFATWWWSFYTLAIVSCVLAIAAQLILISPPPTPKQMQPFRAKLGDIDWLGAITGVGGLICVQISLVSAPASGWSTQYIFMLLIVGALLIAFFVIIELKVATQPLVPFKMLRADVGFVLGAVACGWATFGIWTWFLWKYLLGIKHDSPLDAAFRVLPIVPVAVIASVLTAWMMRSCRPSWTLFWALVAFTLGPLLLAVNPSIEKTPYWTWTFVSLLVMPFGMDMSFPAATFVMSNYFPPQQQGVAGSLISTVVNYSISLGLGLASTVEVHFNDHGRNQLAGIRGGWFMGVGLGGLGVLICVVFVIKSIYHPSPQGVKGLPSNPPQVGGPVMPTTPQQLEGRQTRSDTVSSLATTVMAERPSLSGPQYSDVELFNSFNFEIASKCRSSTSATSLRALPTINGNNYHTPTRPGLKAKDSRKIGTYYCSESKQHLNSRSSSQSQLFVASARPLTSAPTRTLLPTELEAAYRPRDSWESEYEEHERERERDHEQQRWSPPGQERVVRNGDSAWNSRAGSRERDADGFGYGSRPAVPRTIMGGNI